MEEKLNRLEKRLKRERAARKEAERILEEKSSELYDVNQKLAVLNAQLEERVRERTKTLNKYVKSLKGSNEELSKLTRVVSHDLKAPLRAIGSLVSFLNDDLKDVENIKPDIFSYVGLIKKRVSRMQNLLTGILDYINVGKTNITLSKVELHPLLEHIIAFDLKFPEGFEFAMEGDLLAVEANKHQLKQVFHHVLENAVKYHDNQKSPKVIIKGVLTDSEYIISIKDNGPGINPKYHHKVFQIFQLLESRDRSENTGIGLPIVRKILELFNATIHVESDLGKGASFIITWPISKVFK